MVGIIPRLLLVVSFFLSILEGASFTESLHNNLIDLRSWLSNGRTRTPPPTSASRFNSWKCIYCLRGIPFPGLAAPF